MQRNLEPPSYSIHNRVVLTEYDLLSTAYDYEIRFPVRNEFCSIIACIFTIICYACDFHKIHTLIFFINTHLSDCIHLQADMQKNITDLMTNFHNEILLRTTTPKMTTTTLKTTTSQPDYADIQSDPMYGMLSSLSEQIGMLEERLEICKLIDKSSLNLLYFIVN